MTLGRIQPNTLRFTLMLGLLAALPPLSIDISQPTLTAMQVQFAAPWNVIGLTITVFMLGFALGQFGAGPLSDRHGRRPVLLASLSGYTAAAVGCALATSAAALIGWRLLQGIAAGACAVLAFTIIRDLFEGDAARTKRSYVTVVFSLAPMVAPALGAFILERAGWRPIYMILSAGGLLLLTVVGVGMAESRVADPPGTIPRRLGRAYQAVFSNPRFVGLAAVNALSYGAIFAYIAGSPEVLMGALKLSAYGYGAFFACTALALTTGAFVSGRCAKAGIGPAGLLWLSLILAAASAVALAILLAFDATSLFVMLPLLLLNLFSRGISAPNAQHMALEPMRDQAGTAASAVGVMQILTGALSSAIVALLLPLIGPSGMSVVMAVLTLSALFLWLWITRKRIVDV